MKKKEPNTLQQKMGFFDEDLKKPQHDEIMLWLDKNAEEIINSLFFKEGKISEKKISNLLESANEYKKAALNTHDYKLKSDSTPKDDLQKHEKIINYLNQWESFDEIPSIPPIKINQRTWEFPVISSINNYTNNKYTVGFVDMLVACSKFSPCVIGFKEDRYTTELIKKIGIGFEAWPLYVFFEVKTEIPSLGEVIRQINYYKTYLKQDFTSAAYVIVCPDDKYKTALKSQGIDFVKYNG